MKKYALAFSALALVVMSQSAMAAATGTVTFTGSVTSKTCDLTPEVDGVVGAVNVNLGVAEVSGTTAAKTVELKPAATGNADCSALAAGDSALISWVGNMDSNGFANQLTGSDAATGAYVTLTPKNGKTATNIAQGNDSTEFTGDKIKDEGAKFEAVLNAKTASGKFSSVATFNVAYK